MKTREELYLTVEYWLENLQNEIFSEVHTYMDENHMNKSQLAEKLGFSRSYVTQILNGEFNFSLKKLIELSLAINKAPSLEFEDLSRFIRKKEGNLEILTSGMSINVGFNDFGDYNLNKEELMTVSKIPA